MSFKHLLCLKEVASGISNNLPSPSLPAICPAGQSAHAHPLLRMPPEHSLRDAFPSYSSAVHMLHSDFRSAVTARLLHTLHGVAAEGC